MPSNAMTAISKSPDSQTERVIRKWLVVFAEIFARELTPFLISSWCELLGDLPAATIETACKQVGRTCRFFPTPGEIRAQLDGAEAKGFELEAASEWQNLLSWIRENVFPDTGVQKGAAKLSAPVEYAAKAAGGIFWIERCAADDLVWARKNFIAAYKNVHDTGQVEHLLGAGEAKRILAKLKSPPPANGTQKKLAVVQERDQPSRAEVREVLDRVSAERPRTVSNESQEDLRKKWEEQKARARAWLAPTNPAGSQAASR